MRHLATSVICLVLLPFSAAAQTPMSEVKIILVDSFGEPIDGEGTIDVKGEGLSKLVHVHGTRAFVNLPFGYYEFTCRNVSDFITTSRLVSVLRSKTEVLFGLSLKDPGQIIGEGKPVTWMVSGSVKRTGPTRAGLVIAKLSGLFSDSSREAEVGQDGKFSLLCTGIGKYRLLILQNQRIAFQKDLEVNIGDPSVINLGLIVPKSE